MKRPSIMRCNHDDCQGENCGECGSPPCCYHTTGCSRFEWEPCDDCGATFVHLADMCAEIRSSREAQNDYHGQMLQDL